MFIKYLKIISKQLVIILLYRVYQNKVNSSKNKCKLKRLRYLVNIFF